MSAAGKTDLLTRLIKIGRAPECDIVLTSQYSSSHHAELILLDNGDILLVDTESSNGTYVNGRKIAPNKEVTVTRRDSITFADQPLDWTAVPSMRVPSDVKAILGIGSNNRNSIQIDGTGVSRFHATVKQKKDGKWYITDHSTNGTLVNGTRIPKNQDYRISAKDEIICGGVSVPNPVKKGSKGGSAAAIAGSCIAAVLVAFCVFVGIKNPFGWFKREEGPIAKPVTPEKIYNKYASSVALIEVGFYFQASCPLSGTEPLNYTLHYDDEGQLFWKSNPGGNEYTVARATGFFVSSDGRLVTSLHVVDPVKYGVEEFAANRIKELYCRAYENRPAFADVSVKTVCKYIRIVPNGKYNKVDNWVNCRIVNTSDDKDIDIAVIQTVTGRLPEGSTCVPLTIKSNMPIASKIYSLGYPVPFLLQDDGHDNVFIDKAVEATFTSGSITNVNKTTYGINAVVTGGASGSPVFDEEGYLVGVISKAFYNGKEYNQCEKAENIINLLK